MVDILLATYNGEKYLLEQLKSIENQTYKYWKLIVRDDCSTDETMEIMEEFKNRFEDKVTIIKSNERLGHMDNFLELLSHTKNGIIFFCDQDDIWDEKKLERAINKIQDIKGPYLYHTDQKIISKNNEVLVKSVMESYKFNLKKLELDNYALFNNVTGCTVAINSDLKNKLLKFPKEKLKFIRYHDWALAIIASLYGEIIYDDFISMSYRLHDSNVTIKNINIKQKIKNLMERPSIKIGDSIQFYELVDFYQKLDSLKLTHSRKANAY